MRANFIFLLTSVFFFTSIAAFAQEAQKKVQPPEQAEQTLEPVAPKDTPMIFSLVSNKDCDDCNWISAEGTIVPETASVFYDFIGKNSNLSTSMVLLHSRGGDPLAAMVLGRLFREKNFNTGVANTVKHGEKEKAEFSKQAGYCADACLWAYLGGRSRVIEQHSIIKLKTYRPPLDEAGYVSGVEVSTRKQQLVEVAYADDYAAQMGFDHNIVFVDWQNADSHQFTNEELISFGILFNANKFSSWEIKPYLAGLAAEAESNDKRRTIRFYCGNSAKRYFEISSFAVISDDILNQLNRKPVFVSILGKKIKLKKSMFYSKDGATTLKLQLVNFNPAILKNNQFVISMPKTYKDLASFFHMKLDDLASFKTASKFALRACTNTRS